MILDLVFVPTALAGHREQLMQSHEVIANCVASMRASAAIAAKEMKRIHDGKLYRCIVDDDGQPIKTFERYCQKFWDFGRSYGGKQVRFAEVVENLEMGTIVPILPKSELQARPLAKLETPDFQAEAWKLAQQMMADKLASGELKQGDADQPLAKVVEEAVAKVRAEYGAQIDQMRDKVGSLKLALETEKAKPPVVQQIIPDDYQRTKAELENAQRQAVEAAQRLKQAKANEAQAVRSGVEQELKRHRDAIEKLEGLAAEKRRTVEMLKQDISRHSVELGKLTEEQEYQRDLKQWLYECRHQIGAASVWAYDKRGVAPGCRTDWESVADGFIALGKAMFMALENASEDGQEAVVGHLIQGGRP